jgi:hypothetical protein
MSLEQTGTHRPYGIFHIQGEGIKEGGELDAAEIVDVAPTLLYLLDQPVPSDMDGKVLEDAISPEYLAEHPIRTIEPDDSAGEGTGESEYTEEEAKQVEERLRSLGYIE